MTVIFTNLNVKEFFSKLNKFIKSSRLIKGITCGVLLFTALFMTLGASGLTFGYTVSYSDKVIAVVGSRADYNEADEIVLNRLDNKTAEKAMVSPKFGLTLTVADKLSSTTDIVRAIINNNEDIVEATALLVDGEVVACSEKADITGLVAQRKSADYIDDATNTAEFTKSIEVKEGYFLKSDLAESEDLQNIINSLEVKTVSVLTKTVEIPFETTNVKTNEKPIGYSAVQTKGENGVSEKTEEIVTVNGSVVSTTTLSEKTVKEQVTQVVTVGTALQYTSATTKAKAAAAGFICPISSGKYTVSAYYGDGRNHKGIDLAADRGTPIFAVAAGTVTYSGFDSDYGYNIIIEHSNGIKTRYAHANALCVKKGVTVAQGDMIATVGSTGWSTGNHLHFEVIVGGNRVNPGPYIGLR